MPNDGFEDPIWDEHRWEAHLNEIEKKSQQLRNFIAPDPSGNIPRWVTLLRENADEHEAVDAFIEEELQIEEAYFPEEEEDEWDDEFEQGLDDLYFDEPDEEEYLFDEAEDDYDAGEEWKELSDAYAMSDYGSIESIEIYNEAREMAAYILQWSECIHPKYLSPQYNEFVASILKIGAKLAGGYSFGFEMEYLGGNIAYNKKALQCANNALALLQENLKEAPIMAEDRYADIHGRLFELRNDIGIYVQELREQFYKGFE